jgi:hypothetical protein
VSFWLLAENQRTDESEMQLAGTRDAPRMDLLSSICFILMVERIGGV